MGRCYEFGVSITDGCERAMVVGPEGGYCGCPDCGQTCPGQFKACASVVAIPGYVPIGAPTTSAAALARRSDSRARATLPPAPSPVAPTSIPSPAAIVVEARDTSTAVRLERLEAAFASGRASAEQHAEAIGDLRSELASRDEDLVRTFERLTEAFQRLTDAVRSEQDARRSLSQDLRHFLDRGARPAESNPEPNPSPAPPPAPVHSTDEAPGPHDHHEAQWDQDPQEARSASMP